MVAIAPDDYNELTEILEFAANSADGARVCANITINTDDLVEGNENFMVVQILEETGLEAVLDPTSTIVTITDTQCKYEFS